MIISAWKSYQQNLMSYPLSLSLQSNSYLGDDKFARKATSNSSTTPAKTLSVVEKAKMSLADPEQARKQREAEERARDAQTAARKAEYNPDPAPTPGKLKSLRDVYEKGSSSETKPKSPGPSALAAWSASIFGANQRSPPASPLQKIGKSLSTRTAGSVAENVSYITESGGSEIDGIKKIGQVPFEPYVCFLNVSTLTSSLRVAYVALILVCYIHISANEIQVCGFYQQW